MTKESNESKREARIEGSTGTEAPATSTSPASLKIRSGVRVGGQPPKRCV